MSTALKLVDLLSKDDAALAATSVLLAQGIFCLDASGVERLTPNQIDALFGALPAEWSFPELGEIIDTATLTPTLAAQLTQWVQYRSSGESVQALAGDDGHETSTANVEPVVRLASGIIHPIHALDRVIDEYRDYLRAEFRAKDAGLRAALERELDAPLFLAQETFYQAHRPFKAGARWRDLPLDGRLARAMERRAGPHAYLHQSEAIAHLLGPGAGPLVVTTGTGSGKTETFLLPVIQNAIADATHYGRRPGLTAILVYPMNALANDQLDRIESYLHDAGLSGVIDVRKYDRGTSQAERQELRRRPPHILLTNYMMLEYLLVRPADREDIFANHRCRFLVLDEVHTYRGTLGSNIALLTRRLRAHLARARQDWRIDVPVDEQAQRFPSLLPIGTSATIKSVAEGELSLEERLRLRDEAVQEFFGTLTGASPTDIRVIGETLEDVQPPTEAVYPTQPGTVDAQRLNVAVPVAVHDALCTLADQPRDTPLDDVARRYRLLWDLNHMLVGGPRSCSQIVERIQETVSARAALPVNVVANEVAAALVIGAALPDGTPGALRLRAHRLIRGGWQFHRCINPTCGKLYPMGEEQCAVCNHRTAPLYLCRSCGADYLQFVGDNPKDPTAAPLMPSTRLGEGAEWLLYEPERFDLTAGDVDEDTGGDEGSTNGARGSQKAPKQMRGRPVEHGSFDPATGFFSRDLSELPMRVILAPARTQCLCCGATLGSRNVLTPVALGTSAAVKVVAEGLVGALADVHRGQPDYDGKERLLVFSDSRQDAAHQAQFIIFASRYDRLRRRMVQLLGDGPLSIQRLVELLREQAVVQHDNPGTENLTRRYLSEEEEQRIQAWEEAPLLDEIALNAGYRASVVNLGLVGVGYDQLAPYVEMEGVSLQAELKINQHEPMYLCRSMLDEISDARLSLTRPAPLQPAPSPLPGVYPLG